MVEQIRRRPAGSTASVPDGAGGLTAAWLSGALDRDVTGVTVTSVGAGQTGSCYRLATTFTDGGTARYVAKMAAENPAVRERVAPGYRTEVAFYRDIAPTLSVPVPAVYVAEETEDGSRFVLLMDDVAPAVPGDQISGATPDIVVAGARALAGLHGPRWCDPAWLELEVLTVPIANEESAALLGDLARTAVDTFLATLGPRMNEADRATLDAVPSAIPEFLLRKPERFALLHGDYRLDNLMLHPDGSVTVLDWQTLTVGLPARDLAYWVTTSVAPEQRAAVEREALPAYLEALGLAGYDMAELADDYRIGQLHTPLLATLGWAFSTQTERGGDMVVAMVERSCAAIRDLEVL
jgi:aminoglycoside phosphotransferase (APT) family kinase protein